MSTIKTLPSLSELVEEAREQEYITSKPVMKAQQGFVVPVPKQRSSVVREHNSLQDYSMPVHMRQRKDTPEEIAAQRQQRIAASVQARKIPWTRDNWRERMAAETTTGDKLSLQELPVVGKYIPGALDPTAGIGHMVSALGSAPLRAKQTNSLMPYVSAIGMPLALGAVAGLGTKSAGEFTNNIINPIAGTRVAAALKKSITTKIFPKAKVRILPEKLIPNVEHMSAASRFDPHTKVNLIDKNKKSYGFIELTNKPNYAIDKTTGKVLLDPVTQLPMINPQQWNRPHMIKVDDVLKGNKTQDVLYELGIQESKKKGLKGLYSGEDLMMPEATMKSYDRFNREIFGNKETTFLKEVSPGLHARQKATHDVVGLTGHKNPNIITDWMENYKNVNKFSPREYASVSDIGKSMYNNRKTIGISAAITSSIASERNNNNNTVLRYASNNKSQ